MPVYWIEGLYTPKAKRRPAKAAPQPYAKAIWANSPAEALSIAATELDGGQWLEPPAVSQTTEEQRMRDLGAPQLPGFGPTPAKKRRK